MWQFALALITGFALGATAVPVLAEPPPWPDGGIVFGGGR